MLHLRIALLSLFAIPSLAFAATESTPVPNDSVVHIAEKAKKGFHADDAMFIISLENGRQNDQAFSVVKGILNGHHPTRVNTKSQMSYYILGGDCRFTLAKEAIAPAKGDYLTIKPNIAYAIDGKACEMLILSNPPFEKKYNKLVDSQ